MATMKSSGDLISSISTDMADNNAGLISAEDVRHNMEDTVFSINRIVCSGDLDVKFPFYEVVRVSKAKAAGASTTKTNGDIVLDSGIFFPNAPENSTKRQDRPWLGDGGIDHGSIAGLGDDDHTIYYAINGARALTANFKAGNNWVNASGYDAIGIKFVPVGPGHEQEIYTSGTLRFSDLSSVPNGKGSAKAWINFDASGTNNLPKIRGYHGISGVERLNPGKFKITFTSGTFNHNNYVAVGSSNATTSSGSKEDFSVNTVGLVLRDKVDNNPDLRSVTCVIKNENGDYVDSEMIDCVFYGWEPNEASGAQIPTTSIASSYTDP